MTDPANPRELAPGTTGTGGANNFSVNPILPLAAAGATPSEAVQLWDISSRTRPTLLGTLGESGTETQGLAFSPDGALLAAPTQKGGVRLWRVAQHARPTPARDLPDARGKATALAFSPRDRMLLVGDETGTITTWDVSRPDRPVRKGTSTRHTAAITGLAFHLGGELHDVDWTNTPAPGEFCGVKGLCAFCVLPLSSKDGLPAPWAPSSGGPRPGPWQPSPRRARRRS